jgi:hypothetical protein
MNDDDMEFPKASPLSQSVERDGRSVSIEIYDDGAGKWLLEVVDEFNNSAVWEGVFDTDDMALKEALDTIEEEGIQALIGAPPDTV